MRIKTYKQSSTSASFCVRGKNNNNWIKQRAKSGPAFFGQRPKISQNTIELYQYIDTLKIFSVHNPEPVDLDNKLETVIRLCQPRKNTQQANSKMTQSKIQKFGRCRSEELKDKCSNIVRGKQQGNRMVKMGKNTFRNVINSVAPKQDPQQEDKLAVEMIESYEKDKVLLQNTISNFKMKVEETKKNRSVSEGSQYHWEQKKIRKLSESASLPFHVTADFPSEEPLYRRGLKGKSQLSKIQADDYFILSGNSILKADYKKQPPSYDQGKVNSRNLNKQKKYIKSYILKKRQAKAYFLRLASPGKDSP